MIEHNSPDWLTESAARVLAAMINDYWRSKGHDAGAHAKPQHDKFRPNTHREEKVWVVRSTMHNGKPMAQSEAVLP